ncbi:hypothetical protein GGR56DRAFT_61959 [Xylariaceae sp. FL0804]|nr:hypothetical protein GGR56DRAFT_61959 [Xylariaceae sp. FL0804]
MRVPAATWCVSPHCITTISFLFLSCSITYLQHLHRLTTTLPIYPISRQGGYTSRVYTRLTGSATAYTCRTE